jgi:hypothetical protein
MSNLDDRFIAFVCDNGPLTMDENVRRIGGTHEQVDCILRWVSGNDQRARLRYERPKALLDGRIEVKSPTKRGRGGRVLVEREMRSCAVIVREVRGQDAAAVLRGRPCGLTGRAGAGARSGRPAGPRTSRGSAA